MLIEKALVQSVEKIADGIFLLSVHSPKISATILPGQFCNIKVNEADFPLLRRPFSVSDVEGESLSFMFDVHGEGTKILSLKKKNDIINILGPLGKGFNPVGDYENAVIIAGGIGVAIFPYLIRTLSTDKNIFSLVGARSKKQIVIQGLKNIYASTDDGSEGLHGNVVDLLKSKIVKISEKNFRIFACGPNAMLKALQKYCIENNYDCQISVECAMACGFGICQGCPVDNYDGNGYSLVCKDGPVFDVKAVRL